MLREPGDHVAAARRREEETWTGVGEDWLDSLGESEPLEIGRPLASGQRVRVFGGYDTNPAWLKDDPDGYEGVVVEFIPGGRASAAVIALDVPLFAGGIEGEIVVLEQAWEGIPGAKPRRESMSSCATSHPSTRGGRIAAAAHGSSRTRPSRSSKAEPRRHGAPRLQLAKGTPRTSGQRRLASGPTSTCVRSLRMKSNRVSAAR